MKGSEKQIIWANDIISKIEEAAAAITDEKSQFLFRTVISCCKAEDTYAGDVIELFAQVAQKPIADIARSAASHMTYTENSLRNAIYAAAAANK